MDNPETELAATEPAKLQPNRIDVNKAYKLHLKGMSLTDIGKVFSVTPSAVHQRLKHLIDVNKDPELTNAYRENEAEVLDAVAMNLASNLLKKSGDTKASVNNLAYSMRQTFDIRRMLRGESTNNISVLSKCIIASEELHKQDRDKLIIPD